MTAVRAPSVMAQLRYEVKGSGTILAVPGSRAGLYLCMWRCVLFKLTVTSTNLILLSSARALGKFWTQGGFSWGTSTIPTICRGRRVVANLVHSGEYAFGASTRAHGRWVTSRLRPPPLRVGH